MNAVKRLVTAVKEAWSGTAFREAAGATIDDDEDNWRRLSDDTGRDLSPLSQSRMQDTALYLWDTNMLANRIVELQVAYLLAEGVTLSAKDKTQQPIIDRFWRDPINSMDIKLPKKVRELALFGEQCWPTFVNERTGRVRLGYLDPKNIATVVLDPDNPEQPIGVVTRRDRKGNTQRYRIIINGSESDSFTERTRAIRESFNDGDAFYFTVNDLSLSRRGRSDLRAAADWLDGYEQFLFGELDRYAFLRAFVWDVTLKGATPEEIEEKARKMQAPRSGSVRVHNESEEWNTVSPDVEAADTSEGARMIRNHVLGGASMPEHWYGGGGDVNRAAAAEMGEPTFKVFSMRQRMIKHILECMGTYALRQAMLAESDEEPKIEQTEVEAVFPEMTARDTTKYATALGQVVTGVAMAVQRGFMSEGTATKLIASVATKLGIKIDATAELTTARKEAGKRAEGDTFPGSADVTDDAQ